ncbi:MAG: BTAD domain-containing putative transcriptional regulator [Thermoflexales bacterium]
MAVRTKAPKLRRQWIARSNTLAALENTLDFALVLIAAPAGYGKTTLAAQYAASQPSVCAWLTLTVEERDPAILAARMRESILGLHPELQKSAPAACAEPQPGAKTLITLLSAEGVAPMTLVLDDLGSVDEAPVAIELIYTLARSAPEGITILALSRALPRSSPDPLVARQQATILGPTLLKLHEDEAREMIARLRGVRPELVAADDVATALVDSEGWPAGLALAEQASAMVEDQGGSSADKAADLIDEYLAGAVFAEVPPDTLNFLRHVSMLDSFTEAQCARAGVPDWETGLQDAQRLNLFLSSTGAGGAERVYRIHPQVRASLQRAFAHLNPADYARASAPKPIIEAQNGALSVLEPINGNRIEARGFGVGRVLRNGELMTAAQWGYNIPRELLFFMLTAKTSTRERIGGVFWPDASTSTMQRGFHNAKFAIRTALKDQAILYADGVYSVNTSLDLTYDVWEFEKLVTAAGRAGQNEALKMYLSAAELYTEDFLVDSTLDWALETRRRLQTKFVRSCIEAAGLALRRNQPELISELLMRAYYHDRTREELARTLIVTQAGMGNRTAALETYADLSSVLRRELSINPQPETEELARRLRLGEPVNDLLPPMRRSQP